MRRTPALFFCVLIARACFGQAAAAGNIVVVADDGSVVGHNNLFNLDGSTILFTPNAAGGYDASATDPAWDDDVGDPLPMDLPARQSTEVPLGFSFPFAGKTWSSVVVNYTGSLGFGWREDAVTRDRYFFFDDMAASFVSGPPMIAPYWRRFYGDWALGDGGNRFYVKRAADAILITWDVAELYDDPQGYPATRQGNRFQALLSSDGSVVFSYNGMQTLDGITGIYPGPTPLNPAPVLSQTQRSAKAGIATYLAITDARVEQPDDLSVRITYTMAGTIPPPRAQLFYRFFLDFKPPFVPGPLNFNATDCEVDVTASGNAWSVRSCRGTVSFQVSANKVSVTLPLSVLGFPKQFKWFGDAVDFAQTGQFDQVGTLVASVQDSGGNREMHFASALPVAGIRGALYESFHYPLFQSDDISKASQAISRLYYKSFPDAVDFLLLFTNFRFDNQEAASTSFGALNSSIQGIGVSAGTAAAYGSAGRLQGGVNPSWIGSAMYDQSGVDYTGPWDNYDRTMFLLEHEMAHRWLAALDYMNNGVRTPLHDPAPHWLPNVHAPSAFPVNSDRESSPFDGGYFADNGDGTYTNLVHGYFVPTGYGYLDLYAMGLMGPEEVPPFFVLDNMRVVRRSGGHDIVTGTKRVVTIDDVIAAMGKRIPAAANAQKNFTANFVLLVPQGTQPSDDDLARVDAVRARFESFFPQATGGRATLTTAVGN
jgi:hypothetical protein